MRKLLLPLLLALSACATSAPGGYMQAAPAFVPVEAPPAYTPGFAPGTPSEPVYTPPGTGLPMPGQPGFGTPGVKRSPNKRVLPDDYSPKKEPGLWAADGAPVASTTPPPLFGVTLPYPNWATEKETRFWPDLCVVAMHNSAITTGMYNTIIQMSEAFRGCMAARAYALCADGLLNKAATDTQDHALLKQMVAHAQQQVRRLCPDTVEWTTDHADILRHASDDWVKASNQFFRDQRRH